MTASDVLLAGVHLHGQKVVFACTFPGSEAVAFPAGVSRAQKLSTSWIIMVLFFSSVSKEFVEKDLVDVPTITCSIFTVSSHVEIFFFIFPFLTFCYVAKPVNSQSQML